MERWPRGRRRHPAKVLRGCSPSEVQILFSPPKARMKNCSTQKVLLVKCFSPESTKERPFDSASVVVHAFLALT